MPSRRCVLYASSALQEVMLEVLELLEENGGPDATPIIQRYSRVPPAVTGASVLARTQRAAKKEGYVPWKPYTLI